MSNLLKLIRQDLQDFIPYSSARLENKKIAKLALNANELPWENTFSSELINLNRYPQQQPPQLQAQLANYYGVATNEILITRGSDEGIDLLVRLLCQAQQDSILICPPTFGMYETCAKLQGAKIISAPLNPVDYQLDAALLQQRIQPHTKLVFLCSPNNPTGNIIDTATIITLCQTLQQRCIVVVDEAYIEFADTPSVAALINQLPNLVVLRTLSKAFGLAAARLGMVLANQEMISWLQKILSPYPLSSPAIIAAQQAMTSAALIATQQHITLIKQQRESMLQQLLQLPIVNKVWPSQANFLLVKFNQDVDAHCLEHDIVLRNLSSRLDSPNTLRITIGTPDENAFLINFLTQVQQHETT